MELRHMRYFVAVAEELHFGHAAERLYISQPSLSAQISGLEKELGTQLLYRTKRQVRLTEAGKVFLEGARRTLEQSERTMLDTRRVATGKVGRLTVGFVGPASLSVLSSVLSTFGSRYAEVDLDLREMNTTQQLQALHEGRIQVGFLRESGGDHDVLNVRTVLREPMLAALPKDHPLASSRRVSLGELAREPFIALSPRLEPDLHETVMRAFRNGGLAPNVVQEAGQLQIILSLVAEGVGVTLLPASVRNVKRSGVIYRTLREPTPEIGLSVAWREDDPAPVLRAFLDMVEELSYDQTEA